MEMRVSIRKPLACSIIWATSPKMSALQVSIFVVRKKNIGCLCTHRARIFLKQYFLVINRESSICLERIVDTVHIYRRSKSQ